MRPYWSFEDHEKHPEYCWDDHLNEEIWSRSIGVQRRIQGPEEICEEGRFGSQQAMVDGQVVLPWPPDLLGFNWSKPGSLLIIGSAYAGFIREFSGRPASMLLCDYDEKLSWQGFQERFLRDVVAKDRVYYGGLATLLADVLPVKTIATFDLCRASFVRRRRQGGKGDAQGDGVVRDGANVYWRYFEDPARAEPSDWIWRRVVTSRASAVVVLGSIAEHGFLRLARRRCLSIEVAREGSVDISTELNNGKWVADYALDCIQSTSNPEIPRLFKQQRMKYWLENGGRWYSVSGRVDHVERNGRVLPVYHPSVQNDPRFDPQYRLTIPVLRRMLGACS